MSSSLKLHFKALDDKYDTVSLQKYFRFSESAITSNDGNRNVIFMYDSQKHFDHDFALAHSRDNFFGYILI